MVGATAQLSQCVSRHLTSEEKLWVDQHIGFASCSVDCIVPAGDVQQTNLDVHVEDFHEWIVDEDALRIAIEPKVKGMQLTRNLEAFVERKLFTLNCAHAIAAYLGYVKRYQTVDRAMQDNQIRDIVRGALHECGAALIQKHHFDRAAHMEYIEKILRRISDPILEDTVLRVGRQPLRKLGKTDRLLGPANLAMKYGLPHDNLMRGVAAAFLYDAEDDEQSVLLQDKMKRLGVVKVVAEITGYVEGSEAHTKVIQAFNDLQRQRV
jgi:mannitol-1-phosphate 5-dehydrogenase